MDGGNIKMPRAHLGRFLHDEYVCYDLMRFRSRFRGGKDFGGRSEVLYAQVRGQDRKSGFRW